jgi:type III secretion protein J
MMNRRVTTGRRVFRPLGSITLRPRRVAHVLARVCTLLAVAILCACTKTVDMQSGLKDAEANEIVSVLNRNGIEAQKRPTKEGVALSIKEEDLSRATQVLNAAGLPRRNLSNLGQVFKKEGMISTPLEERARYIHGLSEELEYTLQQFDRVVAARVHVVLPERVAPGEPIQPSSAAVFIKYRPPLDEDMVTPRVRNLVASSIPGLSGEAANSKVSVVLVASELESPAYEWTYVGPFRVLQDSAGWLRTILFILIVLSMAGLGLAVAKVLQLNPELDAQLKKHLGKISKSKGGGADEQEAASDTAK